MTGCFSLEMWNSGVLSIKQNCYFFTSSIPQLYFANNKPKTQIVVYKVFY